MKRITPRYLRGFECEMKFYSILRHVSVIQLVFYVHIFDEHVYVKFAFIALITIYMMKHEKFRLHI